MKLEVRPLAVERAIRIRTGRAPARLAASIRRPRKTLCVDIEWCKSRFFSFQAVLVQKRFSEYKPISGSKANQRATTTWWLAPMFRRRYPNVSLDESNMIVKSGKALHIDSTIEFAMYYPADIHPIPAVSRRS